MSIAGKRRYLLAKRYDRFTDPAGEIRRLHQEDRCQLTCHFPSQKYERSSSGRGATLKMMFDAVSDLVSSGERLKLLDAVIFNVLICNVDSHANNYSILIASTYMSSRPRTRHESHQRVGGGRWSRLRGSGLCGEPRQGARQ